MANFNAGAIEATLTLDRSAFARELKQAQADADKFEKRKITIGVELGSISDELKRLSAQANAADDTIEIEPKITGEEKIRRFKEQLDALGGENVKVDVLWAGDGEIRSIKAKLNAIPDETVKVKIEEDKKGMNPATIMGSTRALNGMRFAIAGVAAALPALTAAGAGSVAVLGALAGAASILTVGLGAFALVAIPALDKYKKAVKEAGDDTSKLPAEMLMLKNSVDAYNKTIENLTKNSHVYAVMSVGLDLLNKIMSQMAPVIKAVSDTFLSLLIAMNNWASGPELKTAIEFISSEFGPTFLLVAQIIGNLIRTLGFLTAAFQPFTKQLLGGLAAITAGWAEWAKNLGASEGFQKFIAFVQTTGPLVLEVFRSLGAALINIGIALAPLAGPVLNALIAAFTFISTMNTDALGAILVGVASAIVLFQAWTAAVAVFNLVMAANPIALVIIAIFALAAAFVYLFKNNKTFHDFVMNYLWPAIKFIGEALRGTFNTAVLVVGAAIAVMVTLIRTWITTWVNVVKGGIATFQAVVRGGWAVVSGIFTTVTGTIKTIVSTFWTVVTTAFNTAFSTLKTIVSTALGVLKAAFSGNFGDIPGIISDGFGSIVDTVTGGLGSMQDAVSGGLETVVGLFSDLGSTVAGAVGDLGGVLVSAGSSIISGLISGIKSMIPNVTGVLQGITSKLPEWKGPEPVDKKILRPSGQMVLQGFAEGLKDQIPTIQDLLNSLTTDLPSSVGTPIRTGVKAPATEGMTRDEFMAAMVELIRAIQDNTQPLIGTYNDASKDPREVAEEWWFISKGRGF